jgi:hypothetical protein
MAFMLNSLHTDAGLQPVLTLQSRCEKFCLFEIPVTAYTLVELSGTLAITHITGQTVHEPNRGMYARRTSTITRFACEDDIPLPFQRPAKSTKIQVMTTLEIVPYDARWPLAFAEERDRIAMALGPLALMV